MGFPAETRGVASTGRSGERRGRGGWFLRPVGFAQKVLQQLAGLLTGQRSMEVDAAWALGVRQALTAIVDQLAFQLVSSPRRIVEFHRGLHLLAELRVRNAEDGHI